MIVSKSTSKVKLVSLVLAFVLIIAGLGIVSPDAANAGNSQSFSDLFPSHWAYQSIEKMQAKGIISGYPDGTFQPAKTVTYGEFIKMAVVAVCNEDPGTNAGAGHWAKNYYDKAVEKEFFSNAQIEAFLLSQPIPRKDMALIAANAIDAGVVKDYDALAKTISDVDVNTENEYQIMQSYANGIITGYPDGTFLPDGNLTRAECSAVIYRLIDKTARVMPAVSDPKKQDQDQKVYNELAEMYQIGPIFQVSEKDADKNLDWDGGHYTVVNTEDYAGNIGGNYLYSYNNPKADDPQNLLWTSKARLYDSMDKMNVIVNRTWEWSIEKHNALPELYPEPFQSFRFNYPCMAVFIVKDGEIIEKADKLGPATDHISIAVKTYPTDYDYLVCVDSVTSFEQGASIVAIYPNPFK